MACFRGPEVPGTRGTGAQWPSIDMDDATFQRRTGLSPSDLQRLATLTLFAGLADEAVKRLLSDSTVRRFPVGVGEARGAFMLYSADLSVRTAVARGLQTTTFTRPDHPSNFTHRLPLREDEKSWQVRKYISD